MFLSTICHLNQVERLVGHCYLSVLISFLAHTPTGIPHPQKSATLLQLYSIFAQILNIFYNIINNNY